MVDSILCNSKQHDAALQRNCITNDETTDAYNIISVYRT